MLQLLPFFYYGQQDTKLRQHRPALATCTLESESIRVLWTEVLETLTHWMVRKYIKSPVRISWRFNRDLSELLSILSSGEADFALRLPSLKGPTRLEQFQSSLHPEKERGGCHFCWLALQIEETTFSKCLADISLLDWTEPHDPSWTSPAKGVWLPLHSLVTWATCDCAVWGACGQIRSSPSWTMHPWSQGCDVTAVLLLDTYVLTLYIVKFLKVWSPA